MVNPSFEWDDYKNILNYNKHGVSFEIAQLAFGDVKRIIVKDLSHSKSEARFYCFGKVDNDIITVRFALRNNIIRIIGAGYWRKGKQLYEKENKVYK
jgi:uncharacterized protein